MPQRFPPLAPQTPLNRLPTQALQALPLGEFCVFLLVGLALLLA